MGKPRYTEDETVRQFVIPDLAFRWQRLWNGRVGEDAFQELIKAYAAPERHYHNVHHIRDCLKLAGVISDHLIDRSAVTAAIFYHDAVYDPTRSDNEERSADLAERHLRAMGQSDTFIVEVRDLIMDTRHQVPPESNDGQYLADIDLAILGAAPKEFDAYERAIRQEYAHVPDAPFRAGRSQILRSFLDRPSIYLTDFFRDLYEQNARANLTRSLTTLGAPPPGNGATMPS
jgi:predicted metal-dependent HD superfamily phosphohydrolase